MSRRRPEQLMTYRRDLHRLLIGTIGALAVVVGAVLIVALEVTR